MGVKVRERPKGSGKWGVFVDHKGNRFSKMIGEALALEWPDVNFNERTVEITKSWRYYTQTMGPTKGKKTRTVSLTPMVVDELKKLRSARKVVSIKGAIFADENGERLDCKEVSNTLKEISTRPIILKGLRHTYATLRVAKGDNIMDVSNQLGHYDPGFTLRRYTHWIPGEHKAQVDDLDNMTQTHSPFTT